MQRDSNWRNYFTIIVTGICLMLIFPTLRYGAFIFRNPEPIRVNFDTDLEFQEAKDAYKKEKDKLQRNAIKFGLDLVGGLDAQLRIEREKTLERLLVINRDELKDQLIERQIDANIQLTATRDRLMVKPDDIGNCEQIVSILEDKWTQIFDEIDESDFVASGKTELAIRNSLLNKTIDEAIKKAERKIRDRVDEFGVTLPSVSVQGSDGIRVQIPGVSNSEHVIGEIIRPANLEFYALYDDPTFKRPSDNDPDSHDALVANLFEPTTWTRDDDPAETDKYVKTKTIGETFHGWKLKAGSENAMPAGYIALPGMPLTPLDEQALNKKDPNSPVRRVYIVQRDPENVTTTDLRDANMRFDQMNISNPVYVSLSFGRTGARDFAKLSREYLKKRVAIALDKKVYSAPVFESIIPNGNGMISGGFTQQSAYELALVLKAGSLPADLEVVASREIGPTLGAESIRKSTTALLIGAACVTVFMILYYGMAGVISIVALVLNILVIFGCLDMFNATLTLSGIGGMILTLGMAVDANVLIYERIREEIANGRPVAAAIRSGFGRAFSVILDSNLTTLLAAFVLLQFGEGSVQGFALTMSFGLIANLFTGLTVTFALCTFWFSITGKLSLGALSIFRNPNFDFISTRRLTFPLSAIMAGACLIFLIFNGGPNMAVDFMGGVVTEVRLLPTDNEGKRIETDQSEHLKKAFEAAGLADQAKVQKVIGTDDYIIRLALLSAPTSATLTTEVASSSASPANEISDDESDLSYTQKTIKKVLDETYPKEGEVKIEDSFSVAKEVGQDFSEIAIMVILGASICILIYLWFRFELVFGMAAVLALVHDLTITLGVITMLDIQISLDIVSALMILLGFSVNDTIVIFDRIRENSHSMFGSSFKEICNSAMNRSLSRTIITSLTTIGVMTIMYVFGGHSLAPFAMTLIVGGLVGTYSSDFLATPLVFWWNEREKGKLVEHLGRKGAAIAPPSDVKPSGSGAGRPSAAPSAATPGAAGRGQSRGRR